MPPDLPGMSNPGVSIPGMSEIPSAPGASADALANQEAIRRQMLKRQTEELVTKAVEKPGKLDDWTVKTWLQL